MSDSRDVQIITQGTLDHYRQRAEAFREGTADHDVSQNIDALLRHIQGRPQGRPQGQPPFQILDIGCGPGRDLRTFTKLGHQAIGLDGAEPFVAMARETGCEVWHQDLLQLQLPSQRFDGIFANAVLFHVPRRELPDVLGHLHAALKPGGVLFCSNPRGDNQEGWSGGRYGVWYNWATWKAHVEAAGFSELEHYYRPAGLPRERQPWIASVWRRS